MKSNFLDKLIGVFSPSAELKRLHARGKKELLKRSYDAAYSYKTDDWTSATKGSSNTEIRGAQETLRSKGRDAIRNNPYAGRGLNAIVSNTIGSGIVPNIKGPSELRTRQVNNAWKEWAETPRCDSEGRHNFYSMQALAMRSIVESGEIITLKERDKKSRTLRLLESDFICSYKETVQGKTEDGKIIQGVRLDNSGKVVSYFIYESHPGESMATTATREIEAKNVLHVYRQDRPGQVRGVSWFHSVIRQLADLNEYQQATLINRKVSACFTAFITVNDTDSTLSSADLQAKREAENMLSPGQIRYLAQGENVQMAAPAAVQGYDEYCRQTLRAIASGLNVTYEALTSDYSQVNFSSGRMGHIEFRRNVEMWRWNMLIPQFCEPAFEHFLEYCKNVKGIPTEGITAEWICPSWALIDPDKEISATIKQLRNGLISRPKAILELGYDPQQLDQEIAEANEKLDELEITLDSDPRKTTQAGLFQVTQSQSTQGNQNNVKNDQEESTNGDDTIAD
jgi:lambda family phage portal protein